MTQHRNVIIVGSGPAGSTAALYTARADLAPLVFEGAQYGGALMNTTDVENYPGFPEGIMGPELMTQIRAQAERFGAELVSDDVTSVDLTGPVKVVRTHGGEFTADAVIMATGTVYRKLDLDREDELSGRGVSWCATCDGFFFRDVDIAVVGGGDTAMEEATFLTRFAKSVTVVHRRDSLRASRIMAERAEANPKIKWAWNSGVVDIQGDGTVTGIRLRDTITGEERDLAVGGLFIAIGHEPRSELVRGQLDLTMRATSSPPREPRRIWTACSRPAMWSTTSTVRPSPPPAPGVRPRSTPSATCPPSRTRGVRQFRTRPEPRRA